jgi:Na+/H+ antiporter NhaC
MIDISRIVAGRGVKLGLFVAFAALVWVAVGNPELRVLPGWLSLTPPLIAIVTAFVFRSVLPALLLGLWAGAWVLDGFSLKGLFTSFLGVFADRIPEALLDPEHIAVVLFIMMIGGMIGILASNGGIVAVVEAIQKVAHTRRAGQLLTTGLGFTIFFDDYANTLLVGKTMRPLTDRLRVSREKLAFIVDTTASPVAGLALVSTWIGYEVGMVDANQPAVISQSAYSVFLASLPYCFYPILILVFLLAVAASGRDFGPMHRAETKARHAREPQTGNPEAAEVDAELPDVPPGAPLRLVNFLIPVTVLVASLIIGLVVTGEGEGLRQIIGSSDPYKALMWASFLGALTAGVLTVSQRILTLEQTIDGWYIGMRATLYAVIILVMAWALSTMTQELHAGEFLVTRFGSDLSPHLLPALTFVVAAAISFAIGSCFGTIGIVMPIVLPLSWGVLAQNGLGSPTDLHPIYLAVVASVLAGSIWGDHSSPISDTTILSSMSASCDHLEHVRTQMPYALTVGAVALFVGVLPVGYGVPVWIGLVVSSAAVVGLPFVVGRDIGGDLLDRPRAAESQKTTTRS